MLAMMCAVSMKNVHMMPTSRASLSQNRCSFNRVLTVALCVRVCVCQLVSWLKRRNRRLSLNHRQVNSVIIIIIIIIFIT